jgi:hypothetical protein
MGFNPLAAAWALSWVKALRGPRATLAVPVPQLAMNTLLLTAPGLSLVLLSAHFYRAGSGPLMLACLLLAALLAWPRAWVARLVQVCLLAGAAEWVWTLLGDVQQRIAFGQPWLRLALILAAVTGLTAASALVFRQPGLRQRFGLD